jgi:hypothetical protein
MAAEMFAARVQQNASSCHYEFVGSKTNRVRGGKLICDCRRSHKFGSVIFEWALSKKPIEDVSIK